MATTDTQNPENNTQLAQSPPTETLTDSVQKPTLSEDISPTSTDENENDAARTIYIYTRPQLLTILGSPLVKPPSDMPNLVQWLGSGDSGSADNKKDSDASAQTTTRDRRFRRDNDDNDTPSRPTFRSSLTQPSQMGNFKHQSIRTTDRDRESDKDKDVHERLRNLSDKFDRERLTLPSNSIRSKDRDGAPHLTMGTGRAASQSNGAAPKRPEPREGSKKKAGETSEDWRRGAEPPRPGRDDKREDRGERARSRPRDSSKPRRETSPSRKDRDRDDPRKERDGHRRERDDDQDDSRKWRDDGRRDERLASRKERERDPNWDDRRWTLVEERDSRAKRSSGRERRQHDEGKDREREKDKEPAWMDSAAPLTPGSGIIGAQAADGELDQIQAWKKGIKEREQKDKDKALGKGGISQADTDSVEAILPVTDAPAKHLDEIQLFKLIMKREGDKKSSDSPSDSPSLPSAPHPILAAASSESTNAPDKPAAEPRDLLSMLTGTTISSNSNIASIEPSKEGNVIPIASAILRPADSSVQNSPQIPQFQPPPGSRLLAMRNPSSQSVPMASKPPGGVFTANFTADPTSHSPVQSITPTGFHGNPISRQTSQRGDPARQNFSPFEDQRSRVGYGFDDSQQQQILHESLRRQSGSFAPEDMMAFEQGNFSRRNGGSRFAKFFDNPAQMNASGMKVQNPGYVSNSPLLHQRQEPSPGMLDVGGGDQRAMEDIYAMLQSSTQNPRANASRQSHIASLQLLQQQQQQLQQQQLLHQQQQQLNNASRLEALYDSRLDDRNFVPDGMVPGLRTAPPPRRRNDGLDVLDESMHFNNRHPNLGGQRALEQMYSASVPGLYAQQQMGGGRNVGVSHQQQQFRGGSSPINHNGLHSPQQRIPPGLANLGGRPPHEPAQLGAMHGSLHNNGAQQFNNYSPGGNGFGNGNSPHLRGPLSPQQLGVMGQLGHPGNMGQPQGLTNSLRANAGFTSPPIQQGGQGAFNVRQQQQQQHPMLPPHAHPQHVQQPPPPPAFGNPNSQPAHELMALLMGGQH